MANPHPQLTLLDVISAVCEASSSTEEAARVLGHLLSTGQVHFRVSLVQALRVAAHDIL